MNSAVRVHGTPDPIKTVANVLLGKKNIVLLFSVGKNRSKATLGPQYLRKLHLLGFCSIGSYSVVWGREAI